MQPGFILNVNQHMALSCSPSPEASFILGAKPKHLTPAFRTEANSWTSAPPTPANLASLLFLSQGLCPPSFLCLEHFPPRYSHGSLPHFQSLLKYRLPREAFPMTHPKSLSITQYPLESSHLLYCLSLLHYESYDSRLIFHSCSLPGTESGT